MGLLLTGGQAHDPEGADHFLPSMQAYTLIAAAALELRVRDLMSAPIISCRSSDRIDVVLATMTLRKIRHVPIIDGEQLSGIVSIGDLVKHRLDEKELEANVLLDITRMRAKPPRHLLLNSSRTRWPQGVLGLAFQPSRWARCLNVRFIEQRPHSRWRCGKSSVAKSVPYQLRSVVAWGRSLPRRGEKACHDVRTHLHKALGLMQIVLNGLTHPCLLNLSQL